MLDRDRCGDPGCAAHPQADKCTPGDREHQRHVPRRVLERQGRDPNDRVLRWVEAADGGKDPFFIHHPDGELLHAAGLTAARKGEADAWDVSFTVITREARDAGGEVHDRMPVFLTEDALSPGKLEADQKTPLLTHLEDVSSTIAGQLVPRPVDRQVNNVRSLDRSDPSLIKEV